MNRWVIQKEKHTEVKSGSVLIGVSGAYILVEHEATFNIVSLETGYVDNDRIDWYESIKELLDDYTGLKPLDQNESITLTPEKTGGES